MRVIIRPDYDTCSSWAANYIANCINEHQKLSSRPFVLGLPTGSTPLGTYKKLIELNKAGKVSFKNVITFNMDEYVGLAPEHDQSYHYFMWENFFNHIDIPAENTVVYTETNAKNTGVFFDKAHELMGELLKQEG